MKKWISFLTSLSCLLILSACSEGTTSSSKGLEGYPSTVQDGTVSKVFYDEYISFVEKSEQFSKKTLDELKNVTPSTEKRFVDAMKEYDEYLNNTTYTPTTMADTEIFDYLKKHIDGQKLINSSLFLYTSTDDKDFQDSFRDLLSDAIADNKIAQEKLNEVLIKYNLK